MALQGGTPESKGSTPKHAGDTWPGAEGTHVEYRTMSCRFEPNLELPEEILNAPEALAPKR